MALRFVQIGAGRATTKARWVGVQGDVVFGCTARLRNARPLSNLGPTPLLGLGTTRRRALSTHAALSSSAAAPGASHDAAATLSEKTATFFSQFSPYVDQLPTWFGLTPGAPYAYAISIVAATILIRSAVTLPIALWQRGRTRRMVEIVGPRWSALKREVPVEYARKCRIQGRSHAEYKAMVNEELGRQIKTLVKQNRCAPFATIAIPLAVNIPLFLLLSLTLRTALLASGSPIGAETIPWWSPPADLMAKFEASAKILQARGIEGESLRKLTVMEGPTLAEVDKTMLTPIGLGMLTLINVELGQWLRRTLFDGPGRRDTQSAADDQKQTAEQKTAKEKKEAIAALRSTVIGNTLRAASIAFVVVASQAPAGVTIYWISSAAYTLAQNSAFALIDHRRASAKRDAAGQ